MANIIAPTTRASSGNGDRNTAPLRDHDLRIQRTNDYVARFKWKVTGARTIEAQGFNWLTGESAVRVPFRPLIGSSTVPRTYPSDTLAFDLNTTGLGGLVDGVALASEADLLAWVFLDNTLDSTIYGVGATTRPRVAVTGAPSSGGAVGTTAVFPVTANHGNRIPIGARVLVYEGTTAGSNYNHGTVTATAVSTISVLLDANYGLAANNNTTLAGAATKTIVQLTAFEPRAIATSIEGTVFAGRPYMYLGSIHLQTSSDIRYFRYRGDFLELPDTYVPVTATGVTASASAQTGLGNWVPMHAKDIYCIIGSNITSGTPGQSRTLIAPDNAANIAIDNRNFIGGNLGFNLQTGFIEMLQPSGSIFFSYVETGTLTASYLVNITKYRETEW